MSVTFTANPPGSIADDTNLTFTAVGDVEVVASQAGDGNYNAASVTNLVKVFSVMPDNGPFAGGNTVTVSNGNFGTITNVLVGSAGVTPSASGANGFTITMPAIGLAGVEDIVVQTSDIGDITLGNAYTYNPAGAIGDDPSGVVPPSGSVTGGYKVVISGTNLGNGADVTNVTLCGVSSTIRSQTVSCVWVTAGASGSSIMGDVRVFSISFGETAKSTAFTYEGSTRVVLYDLYLRMEGGVVQVCWQTASEEESVGFDLFRWDGAAWVKVNDSLVMAQDPMGATYCVADAGANGTEAFQYKLVEYETDGGVQTYGPFERAVWTPRLENVVVTPVGVVLRWLSRAGDTYEILKSGDLIRGFAPLATNLPATPPVNSFTNPADSGGAAYYRVGVE